MCSTNLLTYSLPFSAIFLHVPAKGFGVPLLALPARENSICSHQTRFLGSKYTKNAFAYHHNNNVCIVLYAKL